MPQQITTKDRPAVLFVRRGSLSHVNASLIAALRRARPDVDFDDLDLAAELPWRSLASQMILLSTIAEFGLRSCLNRHRFRYRMLHSRAFQNAARRIVHKRIRQRPYVFTLQTQSLFNAANGAIPNLIYTDNVASRDDLAEWDEGLGRPSDVWFEKERLIYHDASHVFTFGSRVHGLLIGHYGLPGDRASVAGTGANITPVAPLETDIARYERRKIIFVGINWERKGGPDLLAAFQSLRQRLPDATLTIVGCEPADAAGVDGCIIRGRVGKDELEKLYRESSCLCVPSRQEPFGNIFVEAGHFALPVVATRVGDIADVVHDGVNGYRVPPSDPVELAEALWQVLKDPVTTMEMGRAGQTVTADYTWDTVARRILAKSPLSPPGDQAR